MSYMDYVPEEESKAHTHPLPEPDSNYCSCCRKAIIHGFENVVEMTALPEALFDFEGNQIGVKGEKRLKAVFHATCFQAGHMGFNSGKKQVECEKCGVLSMAKKLKDGTPIENVCACSCHTGSSFCSLLIV